MSSSEPRAASREPRAAHRAPRTAHGAGARGASAAAHLQLDDPRVGGVVGGEGDDLDAVGDDRVERGLDGAGRVAAHRGDRLPRAVDADSTSQSRRPNLAAGYFLESIVRTVTRSTVVAVASWTS